MREHWKEAAFGFFFWVAMTLLFFQTIVFPPDQHRLERVYLPVILRTAQGLHDGSRVTVLGVDHGSILHMTYLPVNEKGEIPEFTGGGSSQHGQIVLAILHLNSNIEFHPGYSIKTLHSGVLSAKVVDIDPGEGPVHEMLHPRYLQSNEVYSLMKTGRIRLQSGEMLEARNYDDPLTIVADVLYENRADLKTILRNTRQITDRVNSGKGTLALLLNDDRLIRGADGILIDANHLVGQGGDLYESLRESRAAIDLLGTYLVPILMAAAGAP